jgi:LmbE family N-acetylglucosaminyl deacetylase
MSQEAETDAPRSPRSRRIATRIGVGVVGVTLIALVVAAIYVDRLFEEPNATEIDSIVAQLGTRSVLAVFAHPDDEVIVAGLLDDAASRPGVEVRLITVTRGGGGYFDPPVSRREDLAAIRTAEVLKHGFALGLDEQEVWDYEDRDTEEDAFSSDEIESIRAELVRRIRRWRPDLVVTFEPATGYTLNPQHRLVGRIVTEAVRAAAAPGSGESREPHHVAHLVYALAPRRAWRFAGTWGPRVAALQPEPDLAIPADRRVKVRGWGFHESQRGYVRRSFGASLNLVYFFYDKEYYALQDSAGGDL